MPLKRSQEYLHIRRQVADPRPADSWMAEDVHYFVFEMQPEKYAKRGAGDPVALFAMRHGVTAPLTALVVTPEENATQARVTDLKHPGGPVHIVELGEG